ncbi:MAG: class B sortase [Bacilli bacterium]|nr:class B sortase [Bacilli bacterium]
MHKKNKRKLKLNQRTKTLALVTGLLICCCIVLVTLTAMWIVPKNIYKVEDRQKEIKKEQKKDEEGIETVAWLRVQGTMIDTPIVAYEEGKDLSYLDKEDFLWTEAKTAEYKNQIKIMGHNILNLSATPEIGVNYFTKFEDLMAFTYEDFVKENKYIQYSIGDKEYVYKVFAVLYDKSYNLDLYNTDNYSTEEMADYIELVESKSLYDFDIDVDASDDIISLVTCSRLYGVDQKRQFVVVGRLLRDNEKMTNYSFETTEKYEEIQKLMKGEINYEAV